MHSLQALARTIVSCRLRSHLAVGGAIARQAALRASARAQATPAAVHRVSLGLLQRTVGWNQGAAPMGQSAAQMRHRFSSAASSGAKAPPPLANPPRVLSNELGSHLGKTVTVKGWLNHVRSLGKINFLLLRDRTGLTQVVITNKQEWVKVQSLHPGSILSIVGTSVASKQADRVAEVVNPLVTVEAPVHEPPPIEYYKPEMTCKLESLLDHRSLALRNQRMQAIFKIQAEIAHVYHMFMHGAVKAVEYFPPNIISSSSEGGAEFFNVNYFGHKALLAQSSQLYKQIMAGVNERVFSIAPFFRAEPSETRRHLSEGRQLEFEMAFFDHWEELLDIQERFLKCVMKHVREHCQKEMAILGNKSARIPEDVPIPRLTFKQAQHIYFTRTGIDERQEPDLSPAAEKELCAYALETFGTECLFITDWLAVKRPFYAYPKEGHPELTHTFDLLCGGMEISSGGQRRHTYPSVLEGLKLKQLNPVHFEDYLAAFRYGMPPHGGFGLGLERMTMALLQLHNVREAVLFPSDVNRIASSHLSK